MPIAYTNCILLDGTEHMEPRRAAVVTEGERIIAVEPSAPAGCREIDLGGRYLLPGLINLHVHLPGSGAPKDTAKQNPASVRRLMGNPLSRRVIRAMCEGYARMELLSGVTTIRTVGGLGDIDSAIRDRINAGKMAGPRMLVSNMAVSVPGGHMADILAYSARSPQEGREYVRKIAQGRPDLIKLMITGGVLDATVKGEPGVLRMPPDCVAACCEEAHALGFRVAAHVESAEGVRVALEGGVDTIEHGAALDGELTALFKARGAAHICTISPAIPLARFDESIMKSTELTRYNGEIVFEGIVACAKAALAAGIPVGLGTDTACPFVTHYDTWRELEYFRRFVGVSRAFALHTATLRNAQIAGIAAETGSIEPGKCADLLAVAYNPLEDLRALRTPWLVAARGRVIRQPRIKKFPNVEAALDREIAD